MHSWIRTNDYLVQNSVSNRASQLPPPPETLTGGPQPLIANEKKPGKAPGDSGGMAAARGLGQRNWGKPAAQKPPLRLCCIVSHSSKRETTQALPSAENRAARRTTASMTSSLYLLLH